MSTKRVDYIKKIQEIVDTWHEDIKIKYGYLSNEHYEYPFNNKRVFIESKSDINENENLREYVLVKYKSQSDMFGIQQSIEADGYYYILKDILKAIDKL